LTSSGGPSVEENAGAETVLFSTDCPHPAAATRRTFEATLRSIGEEAKEQFYQRSCAVMGF